MKMQQVPLKAFRAHKAQMRTQYDLDELATLTLQVYERGLDAWSPIVAAAHEDEYHIISGHRRHKATLLGSGSQRVGQRQRRSRNHHRSRPRYAPDPRRVSGFSGQTHELRSSTQYADEIIEFVPFEGSEKSQILTLQAANYGSAKPDMLGIAHSFREAVLAGASEAEIARNCGQHPNYVRNHLALTEIPPELARRIAAGDLPMSVATTHGRTARTETHRSGDFCPGE
ncbi:MAG: ParB N-terminal domain-containing protein [Microthrixaceae bacterium]